MVLYAGWDKPGQEEAAGSWTPPDRLAEIALSWDDDADAAARVLARPDVPEQALAEFCRFAAVMLAADMRAAKRLRGCLSAAAGNPSCPPDALEVLSRAAGAALPAAEEQEDWSAAGMCERVIRAVAENVAAPGHAVAPAASSRNVRVRQAAASHPLCPAVVLERLADDPNLDVRLAVAGNAAAPEAVLDRLAVDAYVQVRAAVAGNPGASSACRSLATLSLDEGGPEASPWTGAV